MSAPRLQDDAPGSSGRVPGADTYVFGMIVLLIVTLGAAYLAQAGMRGEMGRFVSYLLSGKSADAAGRADAGPDFSGLHGFYQADIIGQVFSPWLLAAVGMLWVWRRGGFDWSVWGTFTLSSVLCALMVQADWPPAAILVAAGLVGLAAGLVNCLTTAVLARWHWMATAATGVLAVVIAWWAAGGHELDLPVANPPRGLAMVQPVAVVAAVYVLAAVVITALDARQAASSRWYRPLALMASGVLAATGGLCWLAKFGRSVQPGPLAAAADLRVVAAVVLSGTLLLRRTTQTPLALGLLAPAMLVATMWRQLVWDLPQWRLAGNVLILGLMVAGAQLGYLLAWRRNPRSFWPAGLMAAGLVAVAAGANFSVRWQESLTSGVGAILWLTGMAMCVLAGRKPTVQTTMPQTSPEPTPPAQAPPA